MLLYAVMNRELDKYRKQEKRVMKHFIFSPSFQLVFIHPSIHGMQCHAIHLLSQLSSAFYIFLSLYYKHLTFSNYVGICILYFCTSIHE
jgi:hypothetical protein